MANATTESMVSIDIKDQNKRLTDRLTNEVSSMPQPSGYIHKVPGKLLILSEDPYVPRLISVGPYHHGKKHLQASEKYKRWYLPAFLSRSPDVRLSDFVDAIRKIESKIRECYSEAIKLTSDDLVQMMILDGCFILELLNKYQEEESKMDSKDCLFSATWTIPSVRRDLVLLENQVPFIVLDQLFNLSKCRMQSLSLSELIVDFFDPILPSIEITAKDHTFRGKHLLDLLRNYLLYPYQAMEDSPVWKVSGKATIFQPSEVMYFGDSPLWEYTSSATSIQAAGMLFKKKVTANGLLDITFRNGIIEMPSFCVGESWSVLLPNLIALEQCRRDYPDKITSYVVLINKLIGSQKDVRLLCESGIIEGLYMKEEKMVRVIDRICEEVVVDKFYYDGLCNQINGYRRRKSNNWSVALKKNYASGPWHILVFAALLIVLLLTVAEIVGSD